MGGWYLTLGRWRGAPIRLHWTLPLGAFVFTGFRFAAGAWVGFVALILLHELGHALLAMRHRARVVAVDVHGFGGLCRYTGQVTPVGRAIIAWGGVLAQALVLIATRVAIGLAGTPATAFTTQLADVFTATNFMLICINLLPIPPLDGAEAWALFPRLWQRRRARPATRRSHLGLVDPPDAPLSPDTERALREVLDRARERTRN